MGPWPLRAAPCFRPGHFLLSALKVVDNGYCSFLPLFNAEMKNTHHAIQLIDGDGVFNIEGVHGFMNDLMKTVDFGRDGRSYRVVSIMGPQSSGKSTLLNHLFQTNFKELDGSKERHQTTKGILLATCANVDPFTLVMDLEGTDGNERGEDGTTFEKRSALFALAVSDVLIINMWGTSVGLSNASNKPLMKTIIQAMMRLVKPRKIMLLFVIRDKTQTPLKKLKEILIGNMQQIWESVIKSQAHKDIPLNEIFIMEIVTLPNYELQRGPFEEEVKVMKKEFFHLSAIERLTSNGQTIVASDFVASAKHIWQNIKEDKDLDLPSIRVMTANFRCVKITNIILSNLSNDEDLGKLKSEVTQGEPVHQLGKKLRDILVAYLKQWNFFSSVTQASYLYWV